MRFGRKRSTVELTSAQPDDREAILDAERGRLVHADAAVRRSATALDNVHDRQVETAAVLRSSVEVAAALAEHVRTNGIAERLRLSMQLREGHHA